MFKWLKGLFNKKSSKKGGTHLNVKDLIKRMLAGEQLSEEELAAVKAFAEAAEDPKPGDPNPNPPEDSKPGDPAPNPAEDPKPEEDPAPNPAENPKPGDPNPEDPNPGSDPPPAVQPAVNTPDFDEQMKQLQGAIAKMQSEIEEIRLLAIENTKVKEIVPPNQPDSGAALNPAVKKNFFDF